MQECRALSLSLPLSHRATTFGQDAAAKYYTSPIEIKSDE